ncbi:MAG: acyl-CoA carboxylase subunit beta [Elusimicrobia bacterium]|nr:acyl-CoA carboxylase subunit beta [Elusimicrobiota bacterium]
MPAALKKSRSALPSAKTKQLVELKEQCVQGTSPEKIEAQKAKGKLTARERIGYLLDEGSFQEIGLFAKTRAKDFNLQEKCPPGDGVVTGIGRIRGKQVALFAQDFTVLGGSLGLAHAVKIARLMDIAIENKMPIIGLLDSGGARIQEGVDSLDGYAQVFARNVKASGVVPQISAILGPCAGGAVYSPALTDFVFMVEGISHMFITGPDVVEKATGEKVDFATLGGALMHGQQSGVCHFVAQSEPDCFRQIKELLSYLPGSFRESPPSAITTDKETREVPVLELLCEMDPKKPYWVQHAIRQVADEHKFFEIHQNYAKNIVVGFLRLGGKVVGAVANNPAQMAGALDTHASHKAARFIRFLNTFNIPLLTFVDVGGYWPGVDQEQNGIIRHGAKLLFAYAEATIPKVTVILRKAYGGAYIAMGSKFLNGDFNFALPSAEIAVMGPQGAIEILYSKEIKQSQNPAATREQLSREYAEKFASPYQAAAAGSIDEVIEPKMLRTRLIRAFQALAQKRMPGAQVLKGNIPL